MKATFAYIDDHANLIANLCPNPESYCEAWLAFLITNGWTEDEYQTALDNQLFSTAN